MKHTNKILAIMIVTVFLLSVGGHVGSVSSQSLNQVETNFNLLLMTQAGSRTRESTAFFIKQALAPLGINVEILAKPWGQFVGDLLHLSTGQPFDLAVISFNGGGPTPGFMWSYHTTRTSFGQDMYQLHSQKFQDFLLSDTGIDIAEVDALLEDLEFELDPIKRLDLVNEFAELFMTQLIYDIPTIAPTNRVAVWKGFGGPNSEGYDPDEGFIFSSYLGSVWQAGTAADQREAGLREFQASTSGPQKPGNFDSLQSFDTATSLNTQWSEDSLLLFDGSFGPHPGIASQWVVSDYIWVNETDPEHTEFVEKGQHTFLVNPEFQFSATRDGNHLAHSADANDFKLTLDALKSGNRRGVAINGLELYEPVLDYWVNSTLHPDDTLTVRIKPGEVTPDDALTIGGLTALPEHILGGDLTLANGTTFRVADDSSYNYQNTIEWNSYESLQGNTQLGPYTIDEYDATSFWTFVERDDYPFPNEDGIKNIYDNNATAAAALDDLFDTLNTTSWVDTDLGTFGPHARVDATPYYFAYDGFDAEGEGLLLNKLIVKIITDTNANLIAFESGNIDAFGSSNLGANTVAEHEEDPRFQVFETQPNSGPSLVVFNLLNDHLIKRDVRFAIAKALDKQEMTKIFDGFALPAESPVWRVNDKNKPLDFLGAAEDGSDLSWYVPVDGIGYDYAAARDLMRANGYQAEETPEPVAKPEDAPVQEVLSTLGGILGSEMYVGLTALAMTAVVFVRKNKKY